MSAFAELPQPKRKALITAYNNLVAFDDETERLHKAHPALEDKVRVTFYQQGFKEGPIGSNLYSNSGGSFKAKYEIALPGNLSQPLELKVLHWCIAAKYLTGMMSEFWVQIEAKYRGQKADFYYGEYGDPGSDWYEVSHGDTKALFETLARDLNLLENAPTDPDAVTASLTKAFIGKRVASMDCSSAEADVLELIMKEVEKLKTRY